MAEEETVTVTKKESAVEKFKVCGKVLKCEVES